MSESLLEVADRDGVNLRSYLVRDRENVRWRASTISEATLSVMLSARTLGKFISRHEHEEQCSAPSLVELTIQLDRRLRGAEAVITGRRDSVSNFRRYG